MGQDGWRRAAASAVLVSAPGRDDVAEDVAPPGLLDQRVEPPYSSS